MKKLSTEFMCVFTPKNYENFDNRKRFLVSVNRLSIYIGQKNAETAQIRIKKNKSDKCTIKFRTHGKLEIYSK